MKSSLLHFVVASSGLLPVLSRVLDAQDLAIGDWAVRVRCGQEFYNTLLFPGENSLPFADTTGNNDKNILFNHVNRWMRQGPSSLLSPRHEFSCLLSVFPNGTFSLKPTTTTMTVTTAAAMPSETESTTRLPVRGRWQVGPNPYCITDRFYDELKLESCPRELVAMRKRNNHVNGRGRGLRRNKSSTSNNYLDDENDNMRRIQRLAFQLQCRVSGRYSNPFLSKRRDRNTIKARLTHGTLLLMRPDTTRRDKSTPSSSATSVLPRMKHYVRASFLGERILPRRAYISIGSDEMEP
jgi:hypothetical protein